MNLTFAYVPISEIRPGDCVILNQGDAPVWVNHVRVRVSPEGVIGPVCLYRDPTDDEYKDHLEEHDTDLMATWICTSVPTFPILKAVPTQSTINLAH